MTIKFNNVYVGDASTVSGHLESNGKLGKYFDKTYEDYYMSPYSVEKSEVILQQDALDILLKKIKKEKEDIDLLVGGDLQNQIAVTSKLASTTNIPFLGVYNACASSMESVIIASNLIDSKKIDNAICITSSHNLAAEKQFRNPIEYGAPKPMTATFTSTGGACIYLQSKKSDIKVTSATIGRVIDMGEEDVNNVGAIMAPAASDTIYRHLTNMNETVDDYDLILTGDLGIYGAAILKDMIKKEHKINLSNNYNDCGVMLYDMDKEREITAGGSGPVCSCLVNYGYIYDLMKKKKLKKVLFVTTGALYSPTFAFQKETLPGIAHAVCLEVLK